MNNDCIHTNVVPWRIERALLSVIIGILILCSMSRDSAYGQTAFCLTSQITNTTVGESQPPSINALGTRVAFDSFSNITGVNPDFSFELFLYDSVSALLSQLTINATGGILEPSISSDGRYIAFSSASDITGNNADDNREIFLFDTNTTLFSQITNTTGSPEDMNFSPSINSDGSKIAFVSEHNLTGTNGDGSQELFLFDINTMTFSQLTNSSGGDTAQPSMNSDGTRIAFMASGDLTGSNSDNNFEIFLLDTTTLGLTQITNTVSGQNRFPSINGNGTRDRV